MKPENFDCCPECGGKTGVAIDHAPIYAQKWGQAEKSILFYEKSEKITCIDCGYDFSVKKPDTTVKDPDSGATG